MCMCVLTFCAWCSDIAIELEAESCLNATKRGGDAVLDALPNALYRSLYNVFTAS